MSRHPVPGPADTVGWPGGDEREKVRGTVGHHACCSQRVTHRRPGRGGRSFELSASAAPAALSSSLEVGCRGGGAEPLAPLLCGLCLVSTWLLELVTDRQPDARPGRRQNGVGAALGGTGGKECSGKRRPARLDAGRLLPPGNPDPVRFTSWNYSSSGKGALTERPLPALGSVYFVLIFKGTNR